MGAESRWLVTDWGESRNHVRPGQEAANPDVCFPSQAQRKTGASAAGTAEADDATPALHTREEWALRTALKGAGFGRSCHLPEEGERAERPDRPSVQAEKRLPKGHFSRPHQEQ